MYSIQRTEDEINEVLNKASEGVDAGSRWPGMSYEQGVQSALLWLFGDYEDNPMANE